MVSDATPLCNAFLNSSPLYLPSSSVFMVLHYLDDTSRVSYVRVGLNVDVQDAVSGGSQITWKLSHVFVPAPKRISVGSAGAHLQLWRFRTSTEGSDQTAGRSPKRISTSSHARTGSSDDVDDAIASDFL